ncbi:hypothetical protein LC613_06735 [Nostoc sphaeroides CHAB 2801]|uniref:hypothetical protein n=1 Tax=Nostoc sphaeroides TaxID=446679 RepID=UPI000E54059B|nr:hypothetical protein [Nostoc sphaeroides]MCC5627848.1 hypothetical protein [Nostoc sphaeroides CHAB 2801]
MYLTELHTAILTDNGFILPRKESTIWCPGFISNVLIGAVSAFSSWAFYGSGASVELAQLTEQSQISLRFSALAGAFLVGVAGAKWITSEVDKQLLKESVKVAAHKNINEKDCEQMAGKSPRQILNEVKRA